MNYSENIVLVTYTHETWKTYIDAKFYSMVDALDFSDLLLNEFSGYSIFSIEIKQK